MLSRRQAFTAFAAAGLSLALLPVVSHLSTLQAAPMAQLITTTPGPEPTTEGPEPTTEAPTTPPPTTPAPTYPFTGFFAPVDNPPVINEVKAGRGIPMKFSLGGDLGLGIVESGYPISYPVACAGGTIDPIGDSETTDSPSGLSYDASSGQYTYVWKTSKSWSGSCRVFQLRLTDGTDHYASFTFK